MRLRQAVERIIGGGTAEIVAGSMVIVVSLFIFPGTRSENLSLQLLVFSVIVFLRFFPPLALVPLLIASVMWSVGLVDHSMLSGFLVYLAVEYAVSRGRVVVAGVLVAQWLVFAYVITRDLGPRGEDLPAVAFEFLCFLAAAGIGYFRASTYRQQRRQEAAQQQLQHNLRTNLARYLHDSLARTLTMMSMQAELASIQTDEPDIQRKLDNIANSGRTAIEDLRQLVSHLAHADSAATETMWGSWNTASIGASIASAAQMLREAGYNLQCRGIDEHRRLSREVETAFTLAFNEVTANLVKHAPDEADVDITVTDDGQYFIVSIANSRSPLPRTTPKDGSGIGLDSILARMHTVGGDASFTTTPTQWHVSLSVPVTEELENPIS